MRTSSSTAAWAIAATWPWASCGSSATKTSAMSRWELHNPSNEFLTFIHLSKAKNYMDYKEAITHYACPIQNFTFACKDNNIAINHQGKMPVKWPGQGKFILDGTRSSHLYKRYISMDSLPQETNPSCNYVFSANQHPTNTDYPYYYNGYYSETRANRIHQLLENENDFDIQKMESIQLDNTNSFASDAAPVLINHINRTGLNENQKAMLAQMESWKGTYDFNDEDAELFELWWKNTKNFTWDELKQYPFYLKSPDDYILLNLIQKDPSNSYFDKQGTPSIENADDIIQTAFKVAFQEYEEKKKMETPVWSNFNKVNIMHMTEIEAFSRTNMPASGYPEAINATSDSWGPSWRMIVELGDKPKAFGIYGGGQSGNIGSPYYDNFVDDWNKGQYYPLQFYSSGQEAKKQTLTTWTLTK
ncbi:MAG TPA: penicillin acylase family protein [Bacteroidia bacterium]|nr:penicillin acylase family protein [Bacteroidia bacterium]